MKGFSPGWRMSIFTLLLTPLLLLLGNWQVDRGAEKRALETQYLAQLAGLPAPPDAASLAIPFQTIRLTGRYQPNYFLLDNQINNGQVGYWVIQVFLDELNGRFLLNRGFIAGSTDRGVSPSVTVPEGRLSLVATVWPDLGLIPILVDSAWSEGWPKQVQRLEIDRMAKLADAYPVELRLEAGQPGVLVAAPFAQGFSDAKHKGYALTWFGLSITLLLGFVLFGFKRS
ncbi:MAG: surfeit locus 1 family protein [Candidatus Azotimanducaceae bacterium]|jgi:surfeit locus 1 family protein|tara:strand:+ start:1373 stop:2056 length:684 start_codon:yes stop_codon:yes gene_type:complete